ncbi:MAG: SURF1 family cytochrome oxidase biogenesis protein [Actinomycetota bacterium]
MGIVARRCRRRDLRDGRDGVDHIVQRIDLVHHRSSRSSGPLRREHHRSVDRGRGFLALDAPVPDPPGGPVRVVGTVRLADIRRAGQPTESLEATDEFFRLDIERISSAIDLELLPVAVELDISDPIDDGSLQPVAAPELSDGPHLSYAIQWLIFAGAVIIGWVLAVRRSYVTRPR